MRTHALAGGQKKVHGGGEDSLWRRGEEAEGVNSSDCDVEDHSHLYQ